MRYLTMMCCAALLTVAVAPKAQADDYNKLTYVTFSGTVQVPGATLPAGTYTFKLADPESGRRVIQIWDKAASKLITTLLTIPNDRFTSTDQPVLMFKETAVGQPQAVHAWFYPGDRYGQEFVYPKEQAMRIAKANHTPVLFVADNTSADSLKTSQVERVDDSGSAKMEPVTITAANTAPRPDPSVTRFAAQNNGAARRELPRTASQMPLVALLGLGSLIAAFAVRRARLNA